MTADSYMPSDHAAIRASPAGGLVCAFISFTLMIRLSSGFVQRNLPGFEQAFTMYADVSTLLVVTVAMLRGATYRRRPNSAAFAALAFLSLVAAGSMYAEVRATGLGLFGLRSMSLPLLAYAGLRLAPLSPGHRRTIAAVLWLFLMANFLVAFRQGVFGLSDPEQAALIRVGSTYSVDGSFRLPGLQPSGQDFALLAFGTAAWAGARLFSPFRTGAPVLVLAVAAAATGAMALQRGPLLAFIAAVSITFLAAAKRTRTRHSRVFGRIVMAAVTATAGVLLVLTYAPDRSSDVVDMVQSLSELGADDSYRARAAQTIPTSLRLIGDQPLLGYGTGASGPRAATHPVQSPLAGYRLGGLVADNGYFMVALQVGVPGALVFGYLLFAWARHGGFFLEGVDRHGSRCLIVFLGVAMLFGSYWGLTGPMTALLSLAAIGEANDPEARLPSATREDIGRGPR